MQEESVGIGKSAAGLWGYGLWAMGYEMIKGTSGLIWLWSGDLGKPRVKEELVGRL